MKRVVACLVLAVAAAGCGSSEPGWQAEWRKQTRQDLNNPEQVDPVELLQLCAIFDEDDGRGLLKQDLLALWALDSEELEMMDLEYDGPGKSLTEMLDDYGVDMSAKAIDEAAEISISEIERACP